MLKTLNVVIHLEALTVHAKRVMLVKEMFGVKVYLVSIFQSQFDRRILQFSLVYPDSFTLRTKSMNLRGTCSEALQFFLLPQSIRMLYLFNAGYHRLK